MKMNYEWAKIRVARRCQLISLMSPWERVYRKVLTARQRITILRNKRRWLDGPLSDHRPYLYHVLQWLTFTLALYFMGWVIVTHQATSRTCLIRKYNYIFVLPRTESHVILYTIYILIAPKRKFVIVSDILILNYIFYKDTFKLFIIHIPWC